MISVIQVDMLGGLCVTADGAPVLENGAKVNKPWQLFCYLVLHRDTPCTLSRLMDAVWPEEELADPGNVLKNTIYALRRAFKGAESPAESPILFENGGYVCNPAIRFELDTEAFMERAKQAQTARGEEKAALLTEALDLYGGELLPQIADESWVMALSMQYRQLFVECASTLCAFLYEKEAYNELLAVATSAGAVEPLEEEFYLYTFRALFELKMYRSIITAYNRAVRVFSEELGAAPGQELQDIYAEATEQVDSMEQDIMIIKQELQEEAVSGPSSGPLYCTYDVFKYLYQMVARTSERSGRRVAIILMTLRGKPGGMYPTARVTGQAMNQMKSLILGGMLRKSDTVARYSRGQFIIMLSVDKVTNVRQVMERIKQSSASFLDPLDMEVVFANTELEPVG